MVSGSEVLHAKYLRSVSKIGRIKEISEGYGQLNTVIVIDQKRPKGFPEFVPKPSNYSRFVCYVRHGGSTVVSGIFQLSGVMQSLISLLWPCVDPYNDVHSSVLSTEYLFTVPRMRKVRSPLPANISTPQREHYAAN